MTTVHVFTITGQSNADGRGEIANAKVPVSGTALQYNNGALSNAVEPIGSSLCTGSAWSAFAIRYYAATGIIPCLVPCAIGGSSLTSAADTGQGNWSSTGTLRGDAVTKVAAAIAALTTAGYTPIIKGWFIGLGEQDAKAINSSTITAADYTAEFRTLDTYFKSSWGASVPCYIIKTGSDITQPDAGYAAIRAEQETLGTDNGKMIVYRNAVTWPARGLIKNTAHGYQPAYTEMGETPAQAVIQGGPVAEYSSGTWTPILAGSTVAGTHSYGVQAGHWSLANGWLNLNGRIVLTARDAAATGNVLIIGIPEQFKPKSVTGLGWVGNVSPVANTPNITGRTQFSAVVPSSPFAVMIQGIGDNLPAANVDISTINNNFVVAFSVGYPVS